MDFFGGLSSAQRRDTTINWPGLVQRVVDDYRQQTTLAHGVQKDAIQNSWDARKNRKNASDWSCAFQLSPRGATGYYLSITDTGTFGLTGRVLEPAEYFTDLPEIERWARFESLAFTHPDAAASGQLGARGQGKFIFVGASATRRILYDTLRDDGVYRLGARIVEQTSSPIYVWEGVNAAAQLKLYDASLAPLTTVGTRVVIDDPLDEVVEAIMSGMFARHIEETWWPIIQKSGAAIKIVIATGADPVTQVAAVPADTVLPIADSTTHDVWLKERRQIEYEGERLTVKRLHVGRAKAGAVKEDIRGVAIYRGGMKVMSLPMRHVPPTISSAIVGHIEFDGRLDEAMKELESPTHYSFDLSRGVGRKLRLLVEDELGKFAQEKLGQGADPRAVEAERRREAERRALAAINRAAKDLGIIGRRGPGGTQDDGGDGGERGPFTVGFGEIAMPTASRRVDYGDTVRNIAAIVNSRLSTNARFRVRLWLMADDTTVGELGSDDVTSPAENPSPKVEGNDILFAPELHEPGEYVLRATAALLDATDGIPKGQQAKRAFRLWLEMDPPERGIFESIEGLGYGESSKIDAEVVKSEAGGWKFQYNVQHPAKRREDQSEDDLFDYLFRLMARELVYIDARSDEPTQFSADDLAEPERILRKAAEVVGAITFRYYQ